VNRAWPRITSGGAASGYGEGPHEARGFPLFLLAVNYVWFNRAGRWVRTARARTAGRLDIFGSRLGEERVHSSVLANKAEKL